MKILKYLIPTLSGIVLFQGCSKPLDDQPTAPQNGASLTVQLKPEGLTASRSIAADDSSIERVTGYRFSQGVLQETVSGIPSGDEGTYTFPLKELSGEIHFVANDASGIFEAAQAGSYSLDEFLGTHTTLDRIAGDRLVMTGKTTIDEHSSNVLTVRMRRSVARIDLYNPDRGVLVHQVTIRGIADQGYVNEQTVPQSPAAAEMSEFSKVYSETPMGNGRESLLYLSEQADMELTAEVLAEFGGGVHQMTATFPAQILRNHTYTLQVHGKGANAYLTIGTEDWDEGESTDALPALKGIIDLEASLLPENITVNAAQDTVYVSHRGGDFKLALKAEAGSEVTIEGNIRGVTASVVSTTRGLEPLATVAVTSSHRMPHEKQAYLHLSVHRDGIYSGQIVIVFKPNPAQLSGLITLDENGVCDFGRYIEGELGRLVLPEGKTARMEFDADEDPWMTLSQEGDELRILGGWKPNDPKADGRVQEGRLVISDADGSYSESYPIRRRNQGLPVVKIGETWWCKYNLRGNVKSFEDQISIQEDPAASDELADYLNSCDEEELLRLMGDQYQGGRQQGLPLRHNGSAFYHEGMQGSAQNFGTLDPTYMAPEGYQIPDYDDYAIFAGSNNYNIGGIGTRTYQNMAGDNLTVRVIERNVNLLGASYGNVSFYEFQFGTERWVLYGLGHQWNTTPGSISPKMLLLATYGNSGSCWLMEGYAQSDRANQNWLKFTGQNSTKTRVIRCIKSPVEYIYE